MTRGHIGNQHGHKERRNTLWASLQQAFMVALERSHAAESHPQHTAIPMGLLRVDGQRCSLQSHGSAGQSKLREAIHAFDVFFVDVRQRIKVFDFASNLTGIRTGVETGNTANTTEALQ